MGGNLFRATLENFDEAVNNHAVRFERSTERMRHPDFPSQALHF